MPFRWIHEALPLAICIALMVLAVWGFRALRQLRPWPRISLRCCTVVLIVISGLALCLVIAGLCFMESHSALVFSPNRNHAAQVENVDEGAVGGNTSVVLYSIAGFREEQVLGGEFGIVEQHNLHWDGNGRLIITYGGVYGEPPVCYNARDVEIHCQPATIDEIREARSDK